MHFPPVGEQGSTEGLQKMSGSETIKWIPPLPSQTFLTVSPLIAWRAGAGRAEDVVLARGSVETGLVGAEERRAGPCEALVEALVAETSLLPTPVLYAVTVGRTDRARAGKF